MARRRRLALLAVVATALAALLLSWWLGRPNPPFEFLPETVRPKLEWSTDPNLIWYVYPGDSREVCSQAHRELMAKGAQPMGSPYPDGCSYMLEGQQIAISQGWRIEDLTPRVDANGRKRFRYVRTNVEVNIMRFHPQESFWDRLKKRLGL